MYRLFHSRCRREREDSFTAMKDPAQTTYTQIRSSVPFDEANATMPLLDDALDGGVGGNIAASQI